jgi:hypothetical protein
MIEIAISLAVIGFALVAIIGILPTGMNVQKDNREETLVNQDLSVWMNAIRNGAQGLDDLTNYVQSITNYITEYGPVGNKLNSWVNGYTYNDSSVSPKFFLTNGYRIIGLMSTPRFTPDPQGKGGGYLSNHVVAIVRAISGAATEKPPQTNQAMQELTMSYRLVADIAPYGTNYYSTNWTYFQDPALYSPQTNALEIEHRKNYGLLLSNLQTNFHDVRLLFRWPVLPNGNTGNGRQVFRTAVSGRLLATNDIGQPVFFFEPRTYVKAQ